VARDPRNCQIGLAGESRRCAEDGSALVEYVIVLVLLAGAAVAGLAQLTSHANDAIARQSACVATRPAPPGCQPGEALSGEPGEGVP
jgi:Flp pilus assembly pilin Flp